MGLEVLLLNSWADSGRALKRWAIADGIGFASIKEHLA
jgi:hypothetical protein